MIIDRVARIGGALLLGALIEGGALAQTPATPPCPQRGRWGISTAASAKNRPT
jgi:hypothetical protein